MTLYTVIYSGGDESYSYSNIQSIHLTKSGAEKAAKKADEERLIKVEDFIMSIQEYQDYGYELNLTEHPNCPYTKEDFDLMSNQVDIYYKNNQPCKIGRMKLLW